MVRPVQPSPQHQWIPWNEIPKQIRKTLWNSGTSRITLRGPESLANLPRPPEGAWLTGAQLAGNAPVAPLQQPGPPLPPGYRPAQPIQQQPVVNPNLIDRPIPQGGQAPLQPGQFTAEQQGALNQRPGYFTRQQILEDIARILPPRGPGENYEQYANRLNQQIRNNPFMQELFRRQQAGGDIRGPELFDILNPLYAQAGPNAMGELDRILENANRANRGLNVNEQQRVNQLFNELNNSFNSGVGSQRDRGILRERLNGFRRDYENHQQMHPNANFMPLPGQQIGQQPPAQPQQQGGFSQQQGGAPVPQPQPAPGQAAENPRAAFLIDRMNALLGQGRRANRRFTVTEMGQIGDLYRDAQRELGGNIPANLQQPLERIRRDFNAQAMLLNIPGLGEDGALQQQTQAQQLGVPIDQHGNVDMTAYQRQFPHFFNQVGGLINEREAERAIRNLPRNQRPNQMDFFRKIRSDINQIRWANNQGEVGYDFRPGENRANEMQRLQREDATYRASNEYRNTLLPGGLVSETAQQQAPLPAPEEITGGQRPRSMTPPPIQRRGTAQTTTSSSQPTTTITQQQPATPGEARAIGEPAERKRRRARDIFLGAEPTEHQIPIYTRDQLNAMNELRGMGVELLRQAYQPLTPDVQQQHQANTAMQSILNRLQNNDPVGAQQELALAGGAANVLNAANLPGLPGMQQIQQQPAQQPQQPQQRPAYTVRDLQGNLRYYNNQNQEIPAPQQQQNLPPYTAITPQQAFVNQPGQQGFVLPNAPLQPQQQGLAGLLNIPQQVQQAYQNRRQGGGFLNTLQGVLEGGQQAAQGLNNIFGTANQATQIPGRAQQAYQQQGGGLRGVLAGGQQVAQDIGQLGPQNRRYGWEYGPGYGMQYPHPLPWTAANELTRFYEQTVPTLAERFTAAGGGQRSAAFQGALGSAGRGLGLGLAALGEQGQQQQLQQGLAQNQQQLYAQSQAFNQQQALRDFAENQRRYGQQQQLGQQQFQANLGGNLAQFGLQPQVQPAINPGGGGILAPLLNLGGQAVRGGIQGAML